MKRTLERLLFGLYLVFSPISCGGNSNNNERDMCTYDCKEDEGVNGKKDLGICCDEGKDLEDMNAPGNDSPSVMYDPMMSRNIRVGTPKELVAIASDPDNDPVECNFDFGDGEESGYGACSLGHTYSAVGKYNVTATARDPGGLEDSVTDTFTAYMNIPPVANAGPDVTVGPGVYCFNFGPCSPPYTCADAMPSSYAPGHAPGDLESYDEDGFIPEDGYIAYPRYVDEENTGTPVNPCTPMNYLTELTDPAYTLRLRVTDNEGAEDFDDIVVNVTP